MLDEELIKKLLATTSFLDFFKIIVLNDIQPEEWEKNKDIYNHFKVLGSKLMSYEECCRTRCYPRRKKD